MFLSVEVFHFSVKIVELEEGRQQKCVVMGQLEITIGQLEFLLFWSHLWPSGGSLKIHVLMFMTNDKSLSVWKKAVVLLGSLWWQLTVYIYYRARWNVTARNYTNLWEFHLLTTDFKFFHETDKLTITLFLKSDPNIKPILKKLPNFIKLYQEPSEIMIRFLFV